MMTSLSVSETSGLPSGPIAVVGATGAVGRSLISALDEAGCESRSIAKSAGIDLEDGSSVRRAFEGVSAAFLMVPFDRSSPDLHAYERAVVDSLVAATAGSGVQRVVALGGTSASLGVDRAGSGTGAALLEQRLLDLGLAELAVLRAAYHMENLTYGFAEIRQSGVFHGPFVPDRSTPMIAAGDVGEVAGNLLVGGPITMPRVSELLGARDYTMQQAAEIMGESIGRTARYVQVDYDTARQSMIDMNVADSFAQAVMDTARSFNEGLRWDLEDRSTVNTTRTTLEKFCRQKAADL